MLYQIVMINARIVGFEADEVETNENAYIFTVGDEVVAEFERKNIAGYVANEIENEDEDYGHKDA